jgi:hypothetical protein
MENEIISKELLSQVFETVKNVEYVECIGNNIFWSGLLYSGLEGNGSINIHELAYRCKEWAYKKDFVIYSARYGNEFGICFLYIDSENPNILNPCFRIKENTEYEAIFQACEYILKQLSNN